jgi:hypothetical protein
LRVRSPFAQLAKDLAESGLGFATYTFVESGRQGHALLRFLRCAPVLSTAESTESRAPLLLSIASIAFR